MAFGLSTSDLDGVLKTLNRIIVNEHERSWKLKHDDVEEFGKTKDELKVFIEEKRYWHKRWEEIHRYLMARKENAGNIMRRKKRANSRQNGSNDRAMKKRGCMKTVVID
ncbi:unnamed protein product [Onchocerca flexuosa]|nr:unnamed protein product [Onchocerca flexuosa]